MYYYNYIFNKKSKNHNRLNNVVNHLTQNNNHNLRDCESCVYNNNCNGIFDIEDNTKLQNNIIINYSMKKEIKKNLLSLKYGFGLPGKYFTSEEIFKADMKYIFHKNWVFAGHTMELPEIGNYITLNVGLCPIVIIKSKDGELKAYHNVCRHRGLKLFENYRGKIETQNIKCLYHGWSYDTNNGNLKFARDMDENKNFNPKDFSLLKVNIIKVNSYIYVCIADNPPDFSQFLQTLEYYTEPYNLENTKIAYQSRIIEEGNWKLVWENNRECYHCLLNHPELTQSFPGNWVQTKNGDFAKKENKELMEKLKLPYDFYSSDNFEFRFMRHMFVKKSISMTMNGEQAIKNNKILGRIPTETNIGNVPFYNYPSTWNHLQADYAISFRVTPISPTKTEVLTTWLVSNDATENIDYDIKELTEVWIATNEQDKMLVEKVQKGISSCAYIPGQFNEKHEIGVIEFNEWYKNIILKNIQ
jgi:Rieske 2Fe-2S family protein